MNELRKYATFSVDFVGQPIKVNSMFSFGRARIFYMGSNPNRSIIEGEAAYKLAASIPGTPIIGLYNYDTEDFEGHGEGQSAFGFVPLEPNPTWVKIDENGKEREYLEVDVVVWDGRFEEAKNILSENKSLSMELNPATLKGTMVRRGEHMYYNITNAEFAGITVLGEDVEPCFKDAGFLNAYSHMVSEYAKYMNNMQENEEGGIDHMENIDEVKVDEVVEPEVNTEETETEVVVDEVMPEAEVEAEESATDVEVVEETTIETDEQPADEVSSEEAPTEETEFAADEDKEDESEEESDDKEDDKEDEKECPECGENPCVCKNSCDKEKEYTLKIAELEAQNESLTQALNAANEALNKYTRKEKLEIISKFSTKLENGEELIASLTEKVDELTKDEIKAELGSALVEQIEAEEVVEEETEEAPSNFSLNINVNDEIGNTAWDLVKRYKANK
jgi:hypothetical protein